jgi:hypothetical protein
MRSLLPRDAEAGRESGQSLVELALVLPLLLFLFLALFDFGRLFAAALTVESAAREAADFGTLYRWHWNATNTPLTEAEMELRACTAASTLPDYEEPTGTVDHETCTNPSFGYQLIYPGDGSPVDCSTVAREDDPCLVQVSMDYEFHVIVPLRLQFFDTTLGLPATVAVTRESTFAVSDFQIDIEPSPVAGP